MREPEISRRRSGEVETVFDLLREAWRSRSLTHVFGDTDVPQGIGASRRSQ